MAERIISTRLILDGEKEYKAAAANISREIKTLDSAVKLVDSTFQGQANTLAALEAKHKALGAALDAQKARLENESNATKKAQEYKEKYAKAAEDARAKLKALQDTTDAAGKETDEYQKSVKQAQAEINKYEKAEQNCTRAVDNHTKNTNAAQIEINKLGQELGKTDKYLDEAKKSTDGCAKSIDEYGKSTKEAKNATITLAEALVAAGVAKTVEEIAKALMACADASKVYESAIAGVAKTTNFTATELEDFRQKLLEMSTTSLPVAAEKLASIAETAGQLGIEKANLTAFTRTMADLGATTNLASEEAALMLSQFAAITGMDQTRFGNLGSSIVALGNNMATNEQKIADMAQGIAGAGSAAGMSEADMLALSAAVTSLGIEAGAGATNMSMLISEIQTAVETGDGLDAFAKVAGTSASQFAKQWGTNAAGALVKFVSGLSNAEGGMLGTIKAMGLNEARMQRMLTSMSGAEQKTGMLSKALNISNEAWASNSALANEASIRYESTASKQTLLENSAKRLQIVVGDRLNPALRKLYEAGTDVNSWAADFIENNQGIVPVIMALVTALGVAAGGFVALAYGAKIAATAMELFHKVTATNPWILAATAIAAVVSAIAAFVITSNEASESAQKLIDANDDLTDSMKAANEGYDTSTAKAEATAKMVNDLCDQLDELKTKTSLTVEEQRRQVYIVDQLNTLLPNLGLTIDAQTGKINTSTTAIRDNAKAMREQALQAAASEKMQAYYAALLDAQTKLAEADTKRIANEKEIGRLEANKASARERLAGISDRLMDIGLTGGTLEEIRSLNDELTALSNYIDLCDVSITSLTDANNSSSDSYKTLQDGVTSAQKDLDTFIAFMAQSLGITDKAADGADDHAGAVNNDTTAVNANTTAVKANTSARNANRTVFSRSTDAYRTFAEIVGDGTGKIEENNRVIIDQNLELLNLTKAGNTLTSEYSQAILARGKAMGVLQEQMDALIAKEAEAREAAKATLDSSASGFEKAQKIRAQSTKTTIAALQSQVKMIEDYNANLKKLQDSGLYTPEAQAEFATGDKKSMEVVAGLAKELEKNPEKAAKTAEAINTSIASLETAKDTAATTMTDMSNDFTTQSDAIIAKAADVNTAYSAMVAGMDQSTDAKTNAEKTGQAIVDGLNTKYALVSKVVDAYLAQLKRLTDADTGGTGGTGGAGEGGGGTDGDHAAGLSSVPFDGYLASLHKNEMVLTALKAKAYRALMSTSVRSNAPSVSSAMPSSGGNKTYVTQTGPAVHVEQLIVRDKQDVDTLAMEIAYLTQRQRAGIGKMV